MKCLPFSVFARILESLMSGRFSFLDVPVVFSCLSVVLWYVAVMYMVDIPNLAGMFVSGTSLAIT